MNVKIGTASQIDDTLCDKLEAAILEILPCYGGRYEKSLVDWFLGICCKGILAVLVGLNGEPESARVVPRTAL